MSTLPISRPTHDPQLYVNIHFTCAMVIWWVVWYRRLVLQSHWDSCIGKWFNIFQIVVAVQRGIMGETFSITIYICIYTYIYIILCYYMIISLWNLLCTQTKDMHLCHSQCGCSIQAVPWLSVYYQYSTLHVESANPARTTPTDHEMPLYQHSQYQHMIHYTCAMVIWWAGQE